MLLSFTCFSFDQLIPILFVKMGYMLIFYRVSVQGSGPGPRYGHVMALVEQRFLMVIGGNDGNSVPLIDSDLYSLHQY